MKTTIRRALPALFFCLLLCVCLSPAAFADGSAYGHTVQALKDAVADGKTSFTLDGNMTIPAGTRADAPGLTFIVPTGRTLTVEGQLNVVTLRLTGGSVYLMADSKFSIYDSLSYQSGSIIIFANADVGIAGAGILSKLGSIFYFPELDGNTELLFYVNNPDELSSVLTSTVGLSNRFHAVVCVDYDCEFDEPTTSIHEGVSLLFRKSFTLPEGCTLQMPEVGNLIVNKDAVAEIYGKVSGSGLIVNPDGLLKLYGQADFRWTALNGTIATFDSTDFTVWEGLSQLRGGRPNGVLHVGGGAFVMIEAKDLDFSLLTDWNVFHGDNSNLTIRFNAKNDERFGSALAAARGFPEHVTGRLLVGYAAVINQNINLDKPKHVELAVSGQRGGSLEIAAGKTLTAQTVILRGATMTVKGILLATGEVQLYEDQGRDPQLTVADGGKFMGPGWISVGNNCGGGNPMSCITGVSLTEGVRYAWNTVYYSQHDVLEAIKAAAGGVSNHLDLSGLGEFTITENITIPPALSISFRDTQPIIPQGVTLTVKGEIFTPAFGLKGGQAVVDGGHLDVNDHRKGAFIMDGTLSVINGGVVDTGSEHWTEHWTAAEKSRISLDSDSRLNIHFETSGEGSAETAIAAAGAVQDARVNPTVELRYPLALTADLTIPEGVRVNSRAGLTVPADRTLRNNGLIEIMKDSAIDVSGTLENNSVISIAQRSGGSDPRLMIESRGVYRGSGRVVVRDQGDTDSYFSGLSLARFEKIPDGSGTKYLPRTDWPALILPADLKEIGAEAFAGGSFDSVYIPAGVTTIDPAAFAGMKGLIICGEADSEAARFAEDKGFTFVVYP